MKLIKKDRIKTPLTAEEIEEAEEIWIKKVQAENFNIQINCLKENKNLPKDSKIRELNPFLNERGFVMISGKLHQSTLSYHEKHPILIPAKVRFTEFLVKDAHEKVLHSGVADTLIQVRTQIMAPLQRDRIEQSPQFAVTGLDFAGPMYVKNSKEKFYVLLCTCAVTRALHLELVSSLTTEAFLLAFRRFISRRGLCTVIGKSSLTSEELDTVLRENESVLNSRPITYIDSNSTGNFSSTPSHFLLRKKLTNLPAEERSIVDCVVDKKVLLKRFNYRGRLLNNFWRQ
ncbi:integrase catalytic domain-containing protein [Trichonephila clavipes]|nr:integrase catalytic domain-containing protein [Trichonephila clavipes]